MAQQQQTRGNAIPVQWGAAHGVAAFVLGYVLTYALLFFEEVTDTVDKTFEFVGWVFFNAQFVGIEGSGDATIDVLSSLASSGQVGLPALAFTAVIALVLVAAGYLLAETVSDPGATTDDGTVNGASIVVGYLPLVFFAAFLFEISEGGTSSAPDIFAAVLLAGIVFPGLLGAIGGYLAIRNRHR